MIKQRNLNRLFFITIVLLALAAGYYHSAWQTEQRKSAYLEKNCPIINQNID